jgi:hypothetical protein
MNHQVQSDRHGPADVPQIADAPQLPQSRPPRQQPGWQRLTERCIDQPRQPPRPAPDQSGRAFSGRAG